MKDMVSLRKQQSGDQFIYKFLQKASSFVKTLSPPQTRILQNVMICNFTLRYFFLGLRQSQVKLLQKLIKGIDEKVNDNRELVKMLKMYLRQCPVQEKQDHESEEGENMGGEHDQLFTYRREAIIMLFELDRPEDFARLNPRDLEIDEEYIRDLLDDPENEQNEMSFIAELDEYEEILQHEEPDIIRLSEILNDLIEYVLDTEAAYVMFRVILKVFNERFNRESKFNQQKQLKPLD